MDTTDQMCALYLIQLVCIHGCFIPTPRGSGEYQMSVLSSHFCRLNDAAGFIFPISYFHRIEAGHIPTPPQFLLMYLSDSLIKECEHISLPLFVFLPNEVKQQMLHCYENKISCKKKKKNPQRFCFLEKATGAWLRLKAEKKVIYNMIKIPRNRKFEDPCFRFLICHTPNFELPYCGDSAAGRFCCFSRITAVFSFTPVTCVRAKAEVWLVYVTTSQHFLLPTHQHV